MTFMSAADCPHRPGTPEWNAWQRACLDREIARRRDENTFGLTHEEHRRWLAGDTNIYTSRLPNVGVIPSRNPRAFDVAKYTYGSASSPWVIIWRSVRHGPVIVMWEKHPPMPHPLGGGIPWLHMDVTGYKSRRLAIDARERMVGLIGECPNDVDLSLNGGDLIDETTAEMWP